MIWFINQAMLAAESIFSDRRRFPDLGARKRSERLEALVLVAKALLYRMDLVTLRVGTGRPDGNSSGITAIALGRWTGMRVGRVTRALADLRDAGYLNAHQPRTIVDGHFVGLASIRNFTIMFFKRLGLSIRLTMERTRASKRRREAEQQRRVDNPPVVDVPARRMLRRLAKKFAAPLSPPAPASTEERGRRHVELQLALRHRYPEWSIDHVRAEAIRLLR